MAGPQLPDHESASAMSAPPMPSAPAAPPPDPMQAKFAAWLGTLQEMTDFLSQQLQQKPGGAGAPMAGPPMPDEGEEL